MSLDRSARWLSLPQSRGRPGRFLIGRDGLGSALARRIKDGGARNLRALYSTACFGATHAPAFVEAGFDVAAGAVGVNANAATEYPFFVGKWILGWNYENSLKPANDAFDEAQDDLARSMGFEGVDSTKIIIGDHDQKIGQR